MPPAPATAPPCCPWTSTSSARPVQDQAEAHDVAIGLRVPQQRRDRQQRVEPAARLILRLAHEVRREALALVCEVARTCRRTGSGAGRTASPPSQTTRQSPPAPVASAAHTPRRGTPRRPHMAYAGPPAPRPSARAAPRTSPPHARAPLRSATPAAACPSSARVKVPNRHCSVSQSPKRPCLTCAGCHPTASFSCQHSLTHRRCPYVPTRLGVVDQRAYRSASSAGRSARSRSP